jgi:CheY-like chemotaxis protein
MSESPKTVLVIDDQEDERAIQSAMLGHLGYRVLEAAGGAAGLRTAAESPPDLIILDVAMPRMDGFSVCREIRSNPRTADVPVLLYTASVLGDLEAQARDVGANGILAKPIDPHKVAAEVRRMIGPPL